jgi:hypothetical protein
MEAIGNYLTSRRLCATAELVEVWVGHHARDIAAGTCLRYVTPLGPWVVGVRGDRRSRLGVGMGIVVLAVFQAVLVGGLGPARRPRSSAFASQGCSAAAPGTGRRISDGDGVA